MAEEIKRKSITKSLDQDDSLHMKIKEKASFNDFFFGKLNWGARNNKANLKIEDVGRNSKQTNKQMLSVCLNVFSLIF